MSRFLLLADASSVHSDAGLAFVIHGPLRRGRFGLCLSRAHWPAKQLRRLCQRTRDGKTTALACKQAVIVEQTHFRWRKEYGGLQVDQAKRLQELEQEIPS